MFLDSDGSFNLLLPDLTTIASWNIGRCDLEHVDRSVSETGRFGFNLCGVCFVW